MDINIIYDEIVEKLEVSNNLDILSELENAYVGAATGSETLMAIGFYLVGLKNKNPMVFKLLEEQNKKVY